MIMAFFEQENFEPISWNLNIDNFAKREETGFVYRFEDIPVSK